MDKESRASKWKRAIVEWALVALVLISVLKLIYVEAEPLLVQMGIL